MRSVGRAGVALAALAMGVGTMAAQVRDWQIDPAHSQVTFSEGPVSGSLHGVKGLIRFEAGNPNAWRVEATIDGNSLSTGEAARDNDLKGAGFFDVQKYPAMTFKSSGVKLDSSSGYQVRGELTLHGVTKPVTLILDSPGEAKAGMDAKNLHRDFRATTTISRKDFGLTGDGNGGAAGDQVKIELDIEAVER